MAIREKCLYCGEPVSQNGYCTACRLNQGFLRKAFNTSEYHYNVALDRARSRDLSGAIDSLKMSLRYNKMNIRSRNLFGLVLYEMGEVVPALSQWVISMNYQPERNPAVRYLKELRDDPKELEHASDMAREFNQALEHAKQHSLDLAQIALRKAVSINHNFIKGHLLMALIYQEQGRKGMARKCLSRVLTLDRTNITALRYLREMGETEQTQSINRQVRRMTALVKDLATFAVFDDTDASRNRCDLSAMAMAAADVTRSQYGEKGDLLRLDVGEHITVTGDSEAMGDMLIELMDNAMKFAETWAQVTITEQNGRVCIVAANDTKLPDGPVDQAMDRFTRLDNARDLPGVGLGLSHVKEIVRFHTGRVNAKVVDGVFTLTVNL